MTGRIKTDRELTDMAQDSLGRAPFARAVAKTIASRQDSGSIIIGIYGEWGDGKSSALRFIEQALCDTHVVCVRFNPWRWGSEDVLLKAFFETMAGSVQRQLEGTGEKAAGMLRKALPLLAMVAKATTAGVVDINAGDLANGMFSDVALVDRKKQIGDLLLKEGKKIVVFVDDIDRLDASEVQALFRLLKLTADIDNIVYVLAFDEAMVAAALDEKYRAGSADPGRHYLEKIVQVPLRLPRPEQGELLAICDAEIREAVDDSGVVLGREQWDEFLTTFIDGFGSRIRTPRVCKRYGNALAFSLGLLKDETYPPDLMIVEAFRVFYPSIYEGIRRSPRPSGEANWMSPALAPLAQGFSASEQDSILKAYRFLFPYGVAEDALRARRRIASDRYFYRYFAYSVSRAQLSERDLDGILSGLRSTTADEVAEKLKIIAGRVGARELFDAIDVCRSKLNGRPEIGKLVAAIARMHAVLLETLGPDRDPIGEQDMSPTKATAPLSQAGSRALETVRGLLDAARFHVAPDWDREREAILEDVISSAPVWFSFGCLELIKSKSDKVGDDKNSLPLVDDQASGRLAAKLAERARKEIDSLGDESNLLVPTIRIWKATAPESIYRNEMADLLKRRPGIAVAIVRRVFSLGHKGLSYASLGNIAEPPALAASIYEAHPDWIAAEPGSEVFQKIPEGVRFFLEYHQDGLSGQ